MIPDDHINEDVRATIANFVARSLSQLSKSKIRFQNLKWVCDITYNTDLSSAAKWAAYVVALLNTESRTNDAYTVRQIRHIESGHKELNTKVGAEELFAAGYLSKKKLPLKRGSVYRAVLAPLQSF
jgi:hypothetical protein